MSEPGEVADASAGPGSASARPAAPEPVRSPPVKATRAGRVWVAIVLGVVVLALLLVFIFQNLHDTTIRFFSLRGSLPVALALLFAALAGAIVVLLVGSVRILQLRRHVRSSFLEGARHSLREGPAELGAGDEKGS